MIISTITDAVSLHTMGSREDWELQELINKYTPLICSYDDFQGNETAQQITETLVDRAIALWESKEELFGEEGIREIERVILLRNVDEKWMDHLEAMDDLRDSINLQAYAQRNPVNEYKLAGAELFDEMILAIRDDTVRQILSAMPKAQPIKRVQVARPSDEGFMKFGSGERRVTRTAQPVKVENKVGRNDPCPCGSGKKYKKCCGAGTADGE